MSLATRCTECGTAFRVVQDQLKVSGGWVRCGRCDGVFDASQQLFELPPAPTEDPRPAPTEDNRSAPAPEQWVVTGNAAEDVLHVDPPALVDTNTPDLGLAWLSAPPAGAPDLATAHEPAATGTDAWLSEPPVSLLTVPPSPPLAPVKLPVPPSAPEAPLAGAPQAEPAWQHAPSTAPSGAPGPAWTKANHDNDNDSHSEGPGGSQDTARFSGVRDHHQDSIGIDDERSDKPNTVISGDEPSDNTDSRQGKDPAHGNMVASDEALAAALPPPVVQALREDIASADSDLTDEELARLGGDSTAEPSFIIQARKKARYQHWAWKLLGGSLVAIAATGLVGQWVHHERDTLQAKYPSTQRWLTQWCQVWSCRLQAPARLSDVAIDSSGLSKVAGSKQLATLQVTLRNQVAWPVAWPAIELTLTDAQGAVISRRILSPKELNVSTPAMGADAEVSLQAVIDTGSTRTVGYAVEAFYP